ncbi:hypothetical protein APPUASWS_012370 [Arthrospira platensis str. Paraca]|nr:hypothetical protein APPUASWS_012370 [Arthrospira platensis str. Paraca]
MGLGGFINIVNYPLIAGWGWAGLLILSLSPITNCGTRPYNYQFIHPRRLFLKTFPSQIMDICTKWRFCQDRSKNGSDFSQKLVHREFNFLVG